MPYKQSRIAQLRNRARGAGDFIRRAVDKIITRLRNLWVNNAIGTADIARTFDRTDGLYIWELGSTEEHCTDCLALNGQIKRASEWRAAGIQPKSPDLECGGWNCDCELIPVPEDES